MSQLSKDIKKSKIYPALVLESLISEHRISHLLKILKAIFFVFIFLVFLGSAAPNFSGLAAYSALIQSLTLKFFGLAVLDLALLLIFLAVQAFMHSYYYFENVISNNYKKGDLYTFTVGRIFLNTKNDYLLAGFLTSSVGREVMERCSFTTAEIDQFLAGRQDKGTSLALHHESVVKLADLGRTLFLENQDLTSLLFAKGIQEEDWLEVIDWVVRQIEEEEFNSRWWRKENLERLGNIGGSWAFGGTYLLDHYSQDLLESPEAVFSPYEIFFRNREVRQMENVLSRDSQSNVLLVGETETVRMDVVWTFVKELRVGYVLPTLKHRRVLLFNTSLLLSSFKDREPFEQEVLKIFNEAVRAGNLIIIFENFADFITGAESIHSNIFSLLDPYFASSRLLIVAMADTDKFHRSLESQAGIMARFEKLVINDLSETDTVLLLTEVTAKTERLNGIRFTYQSLEEVTESAENYFAEGALVEKARGLITELVPWMLRQGKRLITKEDVLAYVRSKTNIPVGEITEEERQKLVTLEEALCSRVVGQANALAAVANAIKRGRAGVRNTKKPIGSFLFLGPTGVGKTETAKALATAYLGSEDKMMRLDMTEYQDADALKRLIGSFADNKPGVLAEMLRDNQYGVLLLDEFEKANKDVLNLFLQILDEGFFSDMNGKKVNARNIIFIATSNAGADQIWQMVKAGIDPTNKKDDIISNIINNGVYKPELLNRFDEVIIFHPLTEKELKDVAALQLKRLASRLEDKGIELLVNDDLVNQVCREGADQAFGARPMNRYILEHVEQKVADKIITGEAGKGSKVEFLTAPAGTGELTVNITK